MKKVFFITFLALCFVSYEIKAQTVPAEKATAIAVDSALLKPYVGIYKSDFGKIKVWLENQLLMGELEGQGSGELRLTDKADVLSIEGMEGNVTFTRNDDKKVVKVKINAQGQIIEGDKVE